MTDELTPSQALALWGLLARQGRAPAAEVKKADRDALVARGFAEADKPSKTVSLTDKGWKWASEHLSSPGLQKQPVLSLFLKRLAAYTAKSEATLASVVGQAPPLPPPAPRSKELRALIQAAYLQITDGRFDEAVRLSRLREELAPHTRKTVDIGLGRISKSKRERARLSQLNDNKAIDAAERDAAFTNEASESFQLLWIKP